MREKTSDLVGNSNFGVDCELKPLVLCPLLHFSWTNKKFGAHCKMSACIANEPRPFLRHDEPFSMFVLKLTIYVEDDSFAYSRLYSITCDT